MALIVQTPVLGSDAIELSAGTWQKRLLPIGQVNYQGRVLNFNRQYLDGLAQAFNSRAYDQVPFQLADAKNSHTNDPERTRGEVTGMQVRDDGLYVTVQTTEAGNAVLRANPKLGVSARIVEDYARADGQYYPVAVQHVLGTLDPRITELGPWEQIEMSNGDDAPDMIIDLSAAEFAGEPAYGELDFAGGQEHPLSPQLRGLADDLDARHPDLAVGDHVRDAADMMDLQLHDGAKRHLRAAMANLTPQSLMRHGMVTDDQYNAGKRSMDDIHRHLLLVQQDQDEPGSAQEADQRARGGQADANRTDGDAMTRPKAASDYGYANNGGSLEFADPMSGAYQALELAHQQAAQRQAEDARDAVRLARRRTGSSVTEDRLSAAMARIGRGTYPPGTGQQALGFANDAAEDMLDRAEEQSRGHDSGCQCAGGLPTRYHVIGCELAELSPDVMGELARDGTMAAYATRPATDASGRQYVNQFGLPADMTTLVQAHAQDRLLNIRVDPGGDHPFETVTERLLPTKTIRFGDPTDEDDPGQEMTAGSREYVRGLAETLGLASPTADSQRERGAQRLAQTGQYRHYKSWGDRMDNDPLIRQRAEQIKGTGQMGVPEGGISEYSNTYADGSYYDGVRLPGELPRYIAL